MPAIIASKIAKRKDDGLHRRLFLHSIQTTNATKFAVIKSSDFVPLVAQAMGISLLRYRLLAFVLSTVYAGIGGIMFMSYLGYASPTNWTLMFSLNLLAAVIIGGTRSLWGTIVGCFIVFGLTPIFFQDIAFLRDNSWFMYALIGVLIILIIMFYQGGLVQLVRDIINGIKKARAKRRLYRYGEEE